MIEDVFPGTADAPLPVSADFDTRVRAGFEARLMPAPGDVVWAPVRRPLLRVWPVVWRFRRG